MIIEYIIKIKIIKMKLLELIKKQFAGLAWEVGKEYVLDPKKLHSIDYDLRQCEEFKDRVIQIVNSPTFEIKSGNIKKSFDVKFINITDRSPLILNKSGSVYLYSISTTDFINYKLRMEIVNEIYDLDGLDDEQKEHIQRMIDDVNSSWKSPDYIRHTIDAYRQENEGKKRFEELAKNDITDVKENMMGFVKAQFSSISKNGNPPYSEGYVEYLNTPGALLMPRDLYEFNKDLIEEWLKSGCAITNGIGFDDWIAEKRRKTISSFNKNELADNLKQIEETYLKNNDKKEKYININGYQLVETMREISEAYAKGEKPDRNEYIEFDNGKAYLNFNGKKSFFADIEDNRKTYNDITKDFDNIEKGIIECDGLEEEQILILKEKLKTFEAKLKEKEIKPKTITISGSVHNRIKNHCGYIGIKIGDWVEKVLLESMQPAIITEELDFAQQENNLKKQKDDLIQTWIKSKDRNRVIVSDKLIMLPNFKFLGYENSNGKPTYDFIGTEEEFKEIKSKISCDIALAEKKRSLISGFNFKEEELGEIDEKALYIARNKY
jgi:hypothetical protein